MQNKCYILILSPFTTLGQQKRRANSTCSLRLAARKTRSLVIMLIRNSLWRFAVGNLTIFSWHYAIHHTWLLLLTYHDFTSI